MTALIRLQLDVVHERSQGNVLEKKRMAGQNIRAIAGSHRGADPEALGRQDISFFAVHVVEKQLGQVRMVSGPRGQASTHVPADQPSRFPVEKD